MHALGVVSLRGRCASMHRNPSSNAGTQTDSPAYQTDPCCNRKLQATQCCAEREVNIMRRELVGVDGAQLQDRCTKDAGKLADIFLGIESFIASEENIVDSEQGCVTVAGRHIERSDVDLTPRWLPRDIQVCHHAEAFPSLS